MAVSTIDALYHSGSEKLTTSATGITVTGNATFGDNNKAIFGAGSDLQIYHDGSKSVIEDSGTGALQIKATDLEIRSSTTNENYIYCVENGAVNLYYNDAQKLATTATGVDVTGTVTSTGLIANVPTNTGLTINSTDVSAIQFNVANGSQKNWGFASTLTAAGDFGLYQSNSNGGNPVTAGTARLYVDATGNLLVGRTSAGSTGNGHSIRGGDSAIFSRDAAGETVQVCRRNDQGDLIQFRRNGNVCGEIVNTGGGSVAYNTSSDYRLKENIVDLTGASARVNQLDVKRFNFIADGTDTVVDGFLAHEVADVVPEAVTGAKDAMRDEEYEVTPAVLDDEGNVTTEAVMGTRSVPKYQGIDQSKLVPLLTAALQEALTEIASLKTRVEALEA